MISIKVWFAFCIQWHFNIRGLSNPKSHQRDKLLCCSLVRSFIKWTRGRTSTTGPKNKTKQKKKLMMIHKAVHSKDDIDRLNVLRKEVGRGLASIQDSVNTSIRGLEDYIKKSWEKLITATRHNTNNTRIKRTTITIKNWKKNNCMDISSNKQSKILIRGLGHGYKRETLSEKLNLF